MIVEAKVSLPALIDLALTTLGGAVYGVVLAFGWFHPTDQQNLKLGLLGAAVVLVIDKLVAYLAPHTSRPDLAPSALAPVPVDPQDGPPAVELTRAGQLPLRKPAGGPGAGQFYAEPATRTTGD